MLSVPSLIPVDSIPATASGRVDQPSPAPARIGEGCRFLCWAVLYGVVVMTVVRPADDWDLWWHLRTGAWIAEHGSVPQTDPFSQFGNGRPWLAYSWLFEVLLHALHQAIGLFGIVLYRTAMAVAVTAAFHRLIHKRVSNFFAAVSLFSAAILVCLPLLTERPWLFTVLFTTLTLDVVLDLRAGRATRLAWGLPLVFALWANLHIQFVYGLCLLGLACVAPVIERVRGCTENGAAATLLGSRAWWNLVGLSAMCALATLLNPYHARLYGVVLEYGSQTGAFGLVQELSAPDFRDLCSWLALTVALAAAFALGRQTRLSAFDVLLLAGTAYLAFRARRDVWFLALASVVILGRYCAVAISTTDRFTWTSPRLALLIGVILAVAPLAGVVRRVTREHMEEVIAARFPATAAAAVERAGCSGPLYNSFDWGGYLIWRLPQLPVAIDGRTNLHGDERLQRSFDTWRGAKGWNDDPELSAAGVVIAETSGPLTSLLRRDHRFNVLHEDELAAVFVRRPDTPNSDEPPACSR
jgi:hypothetical protein